MWSVDRRRQSKNRGRQEATAVDAQETQPLSDGALAKAPDPELPLDAMPAEVPTADDSIPMSIVDSNAEDHAGWLRELAEVGGRNPLLHFEDHPTTRIELSTSHPGGLPQFITGQKILLSQLIRDDLALRHARVAAGRVTDKAIEMRTVRGLETVSLAVGIAKWHFEGEDYCAPLLLRPLAIRRYGRDFELKLKQFPVVNSELIRALSEQFGITLDARTLIELSQSEGVFKPQPVIDRLRQMVVGVPGFVVEPRLVVSSFHNVSQGMLADARSLDTPILSAICGSEPARKRLAEQYRPVNPTLVDTRAPDTDRSLYDADAEQDDVIAQIDAGHSLVVRTLPGTGGTQTVVNAIGNLTRAGKRVLVVSPRRATLDGIAHRLTRVGLSGLAVTPRRLRRNLVESISRNENAAPEQMHEVDEALVRLRGVLLDYQQALHAKDERYGVSALEALRRLTTLSLSERAPSTTVRLGDQALGQLSLDRSAVAEDLTEVARLGQFQYGPDESPWYGVDFDTTEEARKSYGLAVGLAETQLPRLISMANELIGQTPMRPYETVAELGVFLRLLMGIRETLDRFTPQVFDRSLTEVIAAHAPRGPEDMTTANRRRLRKLAREYLRPGMSSSDMYSRLVQVQQQRVLWQRYSAVAGARPKVPLGISDVVVAYQSAYRDLDTLDHALGVDANSERMKNLSLSALATRISELARESEVLQNIQERTAIVERLRAAGLEPLLDDLSARHVPDQDVADELELAWWQSALERMLQSNQALLSANTSVLERLEADFRLVDDAHAGANGAALAAHLADEWRLAVVDNRQEALAMRGVLRGGYASVVALAQSAPNLLSALAPVWVMSPYEVSQLPDSLRFDATLVVDAGATTLVESIGAIRRASQVVAFGDTVTQNPSRFEIGVESPSDREPSSDAMPSESSTFAQLAEVLPMLSLTRSYRAGGEDLTELVNTSFYDGEIQSLPWAGSFLGHSSLSFEFVRGGQGLPDQLTGAVESTDAEVDRVVQLVLEHASERPNESLMVITASERHTVRVYQSVLQAFSKFPQYRDFLLGERAEPFTVLTLEQATAQSRDRVIFSIGFGRTPHGRVLSNFGALGRPGGERLLAVALTRARRTMTIVSCFRPSDLDSTRLKHGVVPLAELLATENAVAAPRTLPAERDPMVGELADRLEALGFTVALDYRGTIPLAASYGDRAIAVEFDLGEGDSLRETLRLRPSVLRRLGWHFARVHSFDLFSDPDEVATRIARVLGVDDAASGHGPDDNSESGPDSALEEK